MSYDRSKGRLKTAGDTGMANSTAAAVSRTRSVSGAECAGRERRRLDAGSRARQRNRVRRLGLVAFYAAIYVLLLAELHVQGLIGARSLVVVAATVGSALLVLYGLFLSGLNCHARDRNLTLPISLGSLLILVLTLYQSSGTRILYAPFSFIVVAYGMYRLSRANMMLLTAVALGGYGAVAGLHWLRSPRAAVDDAALLEWLALAVTLPGFVLLAGRVRRLHRALYRAGLKIRYIEESARRDPLIGCYNRRYMLAALEEHKRIADDSGAPLCLAVIDLDHFKSINDSVGHLAGDEVLRTFAGIAQENVRQADVFGRYGGEEFLLILPGAPLLAALNTVERIREQVECHGWQGRLQGTVTVSIGLTRYVAGESVLDLFARTDTAMYLAKRGGRNQVVVEEPSGELWRAADD